jgi:hypothetical protein
MGDLLLCPPLGEDKIQATERSPLQFIIKLYPPSPYGYSLQRETEYGSFYTGSREEFSNNVVEGTDSTNSSFTIYNLNISSSTNIDKIYYSC